MNTQQFLHYAGFKNRYSVKIIFPLNNKIYEMRRSTILLFSILTSLSMGFAKNDTIFVKAHTFNGIIEGYEDSGIKFFKGVPYAQPPVGKLRWREPQVLAGWQGVKKAHNFGNRAMQLPLYPDMRFRSENINEDCLYLNIWSPAKTETDRLPVLIYFHGGGFVTGDGSEYRYDGESMARQGIVVVTVNYRLGIFGFFSHPELTRESPHNASGNYGFLDQNAALKWIKANIGNFGGNPERITIGGESAGGSSVNAHMASPLSKHIIAGAIGQSGSLLGLRNIATLKQAEQSGLEFAKQINALSLEDLREIPAGKLLELSKNLNIAGQGLIVDGYFFTEKPDETFLKGTQSQIPLLIGWNTLEMGYKSLFGNQPATVENYRQIITARYPSHASELLNLYKVETEEQLPVVASDLAGDLFMAYNAWEWANLHSKTSQKPVYRYIFSRIRTECDKENMAIGAIHSGEIEYLLGNMPSYQRIHCWEPEDYKISQIAQSYLVNFIKTGNPNGIAVPLWTPIKRNIASDVLNMDATTRMEKEKRRERYLWWNKKLF